MNRMVRAIVVAAAGLAGPAWSCTLCYSRIAVAVRAAVLGADFWTNLVALLLPFPILIGAVLVVRRAVP